MNHLKKLTVLLSLTALTACASIIEGSTNQINVTTYPATNCNCQLTNSRGSVTSYAPSTVSIKKSKSDLDITCSDPRSGASGNTKLVSDIEPWAFGNILIGGLIGLGIDWGTGAAYNYPNSAMVTLTTPYQQPVAMPVPPTH